MLNHTDYWQRRRTVVCIIAPLPCLITGPVGLSGGTAKPTAEGWVALEFNMDMSECEVFARQAFFLVILCFHFGGAPLKNYKNMQV